MGGLTAIFITPILRAEVQCFGMNDCFPLAFGVPTIFMAISIVILLLGHPYYQKIVAHKNMFLKICGYFWVISEEVMRFLDLPEFFLQFEIRMFLKRISRYPKDIQNPTNHKFDDSLQKEAQVVKNILVLFLPVPIFWTLYEQHASRWIYQVLNFIWWSDFLRIHFLGFQNGRRSRIRKHQARTHVGAGICSGNSIHPTLWNCDLSFLGDDWNQKSSPENDIRGTLSSNSVHHFWFIGNVCSSRERSYIVANTATYFYGVCWGGS